LNLVFRDSHGLSYLESCNRATSIVNRIEFGGANEILQCFSSVYIGRQRSATLFAAWSHNVNTIVNKVNSRSTGAQRMSVSIWDANAHGEKRSQDFKSAPDTMITCIDFGFGTAAKLSL
jgi:hypothetical protein